MSLCQDFRLNFAHYNGILSPTNPYRSLIEQTHYVLQIRPFAHAFPLLASRSFAKNKGSFETCEGDGDGHRRYYGQWNHVWCH